MSTPTYKGLGQPAGAAIDCITRWFGGVFGGTTSPGYKTASTTTTATIAAAPPTPLSKPSDLTPAIAPSNISCNAVPTSIARDEYVDVIPVGLGPVTIVISPRD